MVQKEQIFSDSCPDELWKNLREEKLKSLLQWNEFFLGLLNIISRPETIQRDYKPHYISEQTKKISIEVSEKAFIKFLEFKAVFLSVNHTLDFLVFTYKNSTWDKRFGGQEKDGFL